MTTFKELDVEETEQFGFEAKPPIQLFENQFNALDQQLQDTFFNCLSISVRFKTIIALYGSTLKLVSVDQLNKLITESDAAEEKISLLELQNDKNIKSIDVSGYGIISQISLSGSENLLFVTYGGSSNAQNKLGYVEVSKLINAGEFTINEFKTFDSAIVSIIPNPYHNDWCAVTLEDDSCHIFKSLVAAECDTFPHASAICWLNREGFVVADSESLHLELFNGDEKSTVELKSGLPADEGPLKPYHLSQIDDDHLLVICADSLLMEPEECFNCSFIVKFTTPTDVTTSNDVGMLYDGTLRRPTFYTSNLRDWCADYPAFTISSSSKCTEFTTITTSNMIAQLNDSDRAQMPMDDDSGLDDTILGLQIDLLNTNDVIAPCNVVEKSGPLPRLAVLSNRGQLLYWNIWYSAGIKKGDCQLQTCVNNELERIQKSSSAKISNDGANISQPQIKPSQQPTSLFQKPQQTPQPQQQQQQNPAAGLFNVSQQSKPFGQQPQTQQQGATGMFNKPASTFGTGTTTNSFSSSSSTTNPFGSGSTTSTNTNSGFGSSSFGQSGFGAAPAATAASTNNQFKLNSGSGGGFSAFANQGTAFSGTPAGGLFGGAAPNTGKSIFDKPSTSGSAFTTGAASSGKSIFDKPSTSGSAFTTGAASSGKSIFSANSASPQKSLFSNAGPSNASTASSSTGFQFGQNNAQKEQPKSQFSFGQSGTQTQNQSQSSGFSFGNASGEAKTPSLGQSNTDTGNDSAFSFANPTTAGPPSNTKSTEVDDDFAAKFSSSSLSGSSLFGGKSDAPTSNPFSFGQKPADSSFSLGQKSTSPAPATVDKKPTVGLNQPSSSGFSGFNVKASAPSSASTTANNSFAFKQPSKGTSGFGGFNSSPAEQGTSFRFDANNNNKNNNIAAPVTTTASPAANNNKSFAFNQPSNTAGGFGAFKSGSTDHSKPLFSLSNNNTNNGNSNSSGPFNPLKNAVRPITPTDGSALSGKPPGSPKKLFIPILQDTTFSLKEETPTPEKKKKPVATKFDINKVKQSFSLDDQFVRDLDSDLGIPKSNKIEELSDDYEEYDNDDSDSSDEEKAQHDDEDDDEDEDDEETTDEEDDEESEMEEEEEDDEGSELEEVEEETFVPEQTPSSVPPPSVEANPSVDKFVEKGSTLVTGDSTVETPSVDETKVDDATLVKDVSPVTDKAQIEPSKTAVVEEKKSVTEDDAQTTETVKKDDSKATEILKTHLLSPNVDAETPSVSPPPVLQEKRKSAGPTDVKSSTAPKNATDDSEKKPELESTIEKTVAPSTTSVEKKDKKKESEGSVESSTEPATADNKEPAVQISDDELERELNEASNGIDEADSPVTPSEPPESKELTDKVSEESGSDGSAKPAGDETSKIPELTSKDIDTEKSNLDEEVEAAPAKVEESSGSEDVAETVNEISPLADGEVSEHSTDSKDKSQDAETEDGIKKETEGGESANAEKATEDGSVTKDVVAEEEKEEVTEKKPVVSVAVSTDPLVDVASWSSKRCCY
ncbi:unnamed protein product [Ambrosiozyma monospora]|uniref:Unnamed protein product n=1 Tax=Ambrosiozyma monospora TaxID=43982 RepID=A0A9W6YWD0_AMBMO|nr:unnamed protein product [Ambrosiozyma monospora]